MIVMPRSSCFFFFNDTATTEIYTLSLHDALPIYSFRAVERALAYEIDRQIKELEAGRAIPQSTRGWDDAKGVTALQRVKDRKSTRLNSSHANISYAVFCLKKKKNYITSLPQHYLH